MTAVRFARRLREHEQFVIIKTCDHGSLTASGPYTFLYWEEEGLIAVVEQNGERFTLGLEHGLSGVEEAVKMDASFICCPEEVPGLLRGQRACSCQ